MFVHEASELGSAGFREFIPKYAARLRKADLSYWLFSDGPSWRDTHRAPYRSMTKNDYVFRYRVRNWRDYNRALVARGRLTFWFDEDAIAGWRNTEQRTGPGTPKVYSDTAIQCALVLKSVFHLSLRATQGFLGSVVGS